MHTFYNLYAYIISNKSISCLMVISRHSEKSFDEDDDDQERLENQARAVDSSAFSPNPENRTYISI